jgi:inositol hexakisphosphate/diphosphoinositol-pentakisphosphate kinase
VLIAFYSNGYPLDKAQAYADLRKPFLLNDLKMQRVLKDRRRVYDLLEASGIDVPRHVFMNRDGYVSNVQGGNVEISDTSDLEETELIEHDDHIEVGGVCIHKPFVEKPVDADDHNIAIYYPTAAGGGCKKLFRKIGDRSSEFYADINEVRREGSYIYEEFVETQGTDVKMYTVGPDYGHAEARKSPTVDGKVERNDDGKEVRFPVILTLREKEIARRIVLVFKQLVCGFDLLRVQEGDSLVSYVCDVNGWSFVKKSRKYYDDCAQILTEHMLAAVKPKELHGFSALDPLLTTMKDFIYTPRRRKERAHLRTISAQEVENHSSFCGAATLEEGALPVRDMPDMLITNQTHKSSASTVNGDDDTTQTASNQTEQVTVKEHKEELRCVIAVVRHGDRTPKQKMKINMSEPLLLDYFHNHCINCKKDLKIKAKKPMTEFLETVKAMIAAKENEAKVGEFSQEGKDTLIHLLHMRDVLVKWKFSGLNRKLQLKPRKWDEFVDEKGTEILRCVEVQLILKWGGDLTKLGEKQAINLGQKLRIRMYPNTPSGGILRLHSTFRHDLKIKTSDEGRVMKTAAAFAKGLLELEGEIPPILVSLVHKEKDSLHMLDPSGNKAVKEELEACKKEVNRKLQQDFDINRSDRNRMEEIVGPRELTSLYVALRKVGNPRKTLFAMRDAIGDLLCQLDEMIGHMTSDMENKHEDGEGLVNDEDGTEALSGIKLYKGETLLELTERWRLLYTKLYDEDKDEFDLSRVPDVHDNVRFDMLHNPHLGLTETLGKLYNLAKIMADCVVPQEYGTSIKEKREIGNKMCSALLEKIKYDLIIARTDNQVDMRYMINLDYSADLPINTMGRRIRSRLYFTSESHLHTLLNVLRFKSEGSTLKSPLSERGIRTIASSPELCYLTQVVIRLFENTNKEPDDPKRFRIEILFSPGATATPLHMSELERDADTSRFDTEPLVLISKENLTCKDIEDYFSESILNGQMKEDDITTTTSFQEVKKVDLISIPEGDSIAQKNSVQSGKNEPSMPSRIPIIEEEEGEQIGTNTAAENADIKVNDSNTVLDEAIDSEDKQKLEVMAKLLSKQYFWTSVAAVSLVVGVGLLILGREVVQNDIKTRKWSRR